MILLALTVPVARTVFVRNFDKAFERNKIYVFFDSDVNFLAGLIRV